MLASGFNRCLAWAVFAIDIFGQSCMRDARAILATYTQSPQGRYPDLIYAAPIAFELRSPPERSLRESL
jgi:hypothetical protein